MAKFLVLSLLFSIHSFGALNKVNEKSLNGLNRKVKTIARDLKKLDRRLGLLNKKYIKTINLKQKLENNIDELNVEIQSKKEQLSIKKKEVITNLRAIVANSYEDEESGVSDLVIKKKLVEGLKKRESRVRAQIASLEIYEKTLETLKTRYQEFLKDEEEIASVIFDLESAKKDKAIAYLEATKERSKIEASIKNLKRKKLIKRMTKVAKSNVAITFETPLKDYHAVEYGKKGITLKYQGRVPIYASYSGRIVYADTLSTFGKVVMIDHGDNTRSLVLGKFDSRVKKGMKVKRGQILGYTRSDLKDDKLYFEVRKKNIVQNTVGLMSKNFLEKNKIII